MRRLSDIKGEETIDVIAELIVPIAAISADDDAAEIFQKRELPEGMTPNQFVIQRIRKSLPALLKSHKEDLITILSVIDGKGNEDYTNGLTMASLIQDVLTIFTDPLLRQFFISQQAATDTSSGPVQESSEGEA